MAKELNQKIIETYIIRLVMKLAEKYGEENLDDILDRLQKGVDDFQEKYKNSTIENINQEEVLNELIDSISQSLKEKVPDFPEIALDVWYQYLKDIEFI
jgi:hypothetical protein